MIKSRGEDEDDEHPLREHDRDRWSGYVQVDPDTMKRITGLRDQGRIFAGRFVCENNNAWGGSFMNDDVHCCRNDLRFMQIYRFVLSKKVGRKKQNSRCVGWTLKYRCRKKK